MALTIVCKDVVQTQMEATDANVSSRVESSWSWKVPRWRLYKECSHSSDPPRCASAGERRRAPLDPLGRPEPALAVTFVEGERLAWTGWLGKQLHWR